MPENKVSWHFLIQAILTRATAFLLRLREHTLCLEQSYRCLFQPLYTCTQTNLRMSYSGQIWGWSEITFILTNEGPRNLTRLIRVDQSQVLEFTQTDKETPAIQLLGLTYTLYRVGQKWGCLPIESFFTLVSLLGHHSLGNDGNKLSRVDDWGWVANSAFKPSLTWSLGWARAELGKHMF